MNRKITNIFGLILLALSLSGCLNYNQVTSLKTDNSGKIFVHYWARIQSPKDSLIIENMGLFSKDTILSEFSSGFSRVDQIQVYTDKDSTKHAQIEIAFNDFNNLNHIRAFKDMKFSIKPGPDNTKILSQFVPAFATGFGFNTSEFRANYAYYIPGEILKHNAHSKQNNLLRWTFTSGQIGSGQELSATYRPFKLKETPQWIYSSALFVLIIVIIFLLKKNKK